MDSWLLHGLIRKNKRKMCEDKDDLLLTQDQSAHIIDQKRLIKVLLAKTGAGTEVWNFHNMKTCKSFLNQFHQDFVIAFVINH